MPNFSRISKERLSSCHPILQSLFNEVIKHRDCSVICGYRGKEEQEKAFSEGKSKAHFGDSKHNYSPSLAVDVMPFPIQWNDKNGIMDFADFVKDTAFKLGIGIRWGGDFSNFFDGPHYELTGTYTESKVTE